MNFFKEAFFGIMSVSRFIRAAGDGNVEEVERRIRKGIDINAVGKNGNTALGEAALMGKDNVIQILLANRANPNLKLQETPLHAASWSNRATLSTIELLLDASAAIDASNVWGITPLHRACGHGYLDRVEMLIQSNANPNLQTIHPYTVGDFKCGAGSTVLHVASQNGYRKLVDLLIMSEANIVLKNKKGQTAFQVAAKKYQGATKEEVQTQFHKSRKQLAHQEAPAPGSQATGPKILQDSQTEPHHVCADSEQKVEAINNALPPKKHSPIKIPDEAAEPEPKPTSGPINTQVSGNEPLEGGYLVVAPDHVSPTDFAQEDEKTDDPKPIEQSPVQQKTLGGILSEHELSGLCHIFSANKITLRDLERSESADIQEILSDIGYTLEPVEKLRLKQAVRQIKNNA